MASQECGLLNNRTFCLITGASKGLGKGIAVQLAEHLAKDSFMVLVARDSQLLAETKSLIPPQIQVSVAPIDLARPSKEEFVKLLTKALKEHGANPQDFQEAMIIHNAGSLGDIVHKAVEMDDPTAWRDYLDFNLNSVICLNSVFLNMFSEQLVPLRVVINITSLAALHPFKTWAYYCTGKAARDMFFQVLAAEEPTLRVLSYAPGPLRTDMTLKAREECGDPEIRQWFIDAYNEDDGKLLEIEYTVACLMELLKGNNFNSGEHVDVENVKHHRKSFSS